MGPWGHKELDTTEQLNTHMANLNYFINLTKYLKSYIKDKETFETNEII